MEKSFKLLICYKKILIYCITEIIIKIIASHIQGLKKHSRYSHGMKEILKYIVYSSQKVSFFASANLKVQNFMYLICYFKKSKLKRFDE